MWHGLDKNAILLKVKGIFILTKMYFIYNWGQLIYSLTMIKLYLFIKKLV
jgi:hypothetical protein